MSEREWFPLPGEIAVGDDGPRLCWTATPIRGTEPALHPIFYTEAEAVELCEAMNSLGWSEDDYFNHAREVNVAMENGTLAALVIKRMARGFWRGLLSVLRGAR